MHNGSRYEEFQMKFQVVHISVYVKMVQVINKFQIFRSSLSSGAKKGKDDDTATSCHGIAWVNLAPLLYPGVTRIKGAALVHPYIESEVLERVCS